MFNSELTPRQMVLIRAPYIRLSLDYALAILNVVGRYPTNRYNHAKQFDSNGSGFA